jgi:hypothetical protein
MQDRLWSGFAEVRAGSDVDGELDAVAGAFALVVAAGHSLAAVTRMDFGGGYESALARVVRVNERDT